MNANQQFYTELQSHKHLLSDLLVDNGLFNNVPEDWHVIITDIVNSTKVVAEGRHHDVNRIATGSMVVVLNIAFSRKVIIPFFFGGDGATFLVPAGIANEVMQALEIYKKSISRNFNLQLRAGKIAVDKIYNDGHHIKIAKYSSSTSFSIPVVLGNGLSHAETIIKSKDDLQFPDERDFERSFENHLIDLSEQKPNMDGMVCRWDVIDPPKNDEEVVTLLIVAKSILQQAEVYRKIFQKIDEIYGLPESRQPISVAKLRVNSTFKQLGAEMRIRLGVIRKLELLKTWFYTQYIRYYFTTEKGKSYLNGLVETSDTLNIDGRINTIISGSSAQRTLLQKMLDEMETNGEITYGIHVSSASIMSCYVRNLEGDHIHFVDGADGGYTKAASMLKRKAKQNN